MGLQIDARKALWIALGFSIAVLGLTILGNPALARFSVPTIDRGASDYLWKLSNPTAWTRSVVWLSYFAHQLASWGTIWYAQRNRTRYTRTLHPVNIAALAINAGFVLWHWLQTQLTYDGLAQDVSVFSSQGSVILMLVIILAMENKRRGLFFGHKIGFRREFFDFLKRYHGYIFSWALIYTFWFHPMVATQGHLVGLLYMFMLIIQSSMFFTTLHINRWWTFVLEFAVLPHGVLVALMGGSDIWPMFLLGFFALVVITQMYGLPIGSRARWAIAGLFITVSVIIPLAMQRPLDRVARDVLSIPLIEYLSVFVLYGLFMLFLGGAGLMRRLTTRRDEQSGAQA